MLTRKYTTTRAVDGISFDVEAGELVGYLGPNGAGKSTTIKMLTGILAQTDGLVEVDGVTPWRHREHNARQIGVVFGQRSALWWDLPLRDSIRIIGTMYGVSHDDYSRRLAHFNEILELADFLDTPVRHLSLGQRMRGDLAAVMLYKPRILYLDEPTIGLDVVAKERIREFVEQLNQDQGTTVILTTHDIADVERLCRRVVLIDHGRVLYDGDLQSLKARYAPYRELRVRVNDASTDVTTIVVPGAETFRREPGEICLRFDPSLPVAHLMATVLDRYEVSDISIIEPELEPVIRKIYSQRAL